ncbi:MAG: M24 family metallopeptidase [Fibrobacterota bacterium]
MMNSRLQQIQDLCREGRFSRILITDPPTVRYISGFDASRAALLISENRALLFTDFRYRTAAQQLCERTEWEFHETDGPFARAVAPFIVAGEALGLQSQHISLDAFRALESALSEDCTFISCSTEISIICGTKAAAEIDAAEKAAKIADHAFSVFSKDLAFGMSEFQAARLLEKHCMDGGSEKPSFDTIVLFGSNAALPHGKPSHTRRLQKGDTVLTDFGCTVNGFASDMTRTVFAGPPAPKMERIYAIVLQAQEKALAALRPGISCAEIDAIARTHIETAGYGDFFKHGTGHGVGLRVHEPPNLNKKSTAQLQPGMLVTVEPGIYIPGFGGVRIEDLASITTNGYHRLSQTPKELKIIL